ncbi:MAG TPA: tetratricopeptide repeat protein [Tepidisphaeraceae bacterium]|jgi:predicted O-linked N-acetylglucosamine transferase (SPINDLY family)|nr:tetratricopeptide repeat protein [Tepidisphaeraceae bacterium]
MSSPNSEQLLQAAREHHRSGRLKEAGKLYQDLLKSKPDDPDALHMLGVVAHQYGRNKAAVKLIRQAIGKRADFPDASNNLGIVLQAMGQNVEAIAAYRQAIALRPNFAEALNNLAIALQWGGRIDEAIAAFQQAIAARPNFSEAFSNLGNALKAKGQINEAIAAYRRAIELKPNSADAYNNLGNALQQSGNLDAAIGAYLQSASAAPFAPPLNNLGNALREKGKLDESVGALQRAIAIKPDYTDAYNNLGNALKDRGQLDDAIAAYRRAIEINPKDALCHGSLVYMLPFHHAYDSRAAAEELRRWNAKFTDPLKILFSPHGNGRDPERRLRIGYVGPNFRNHCQSHFMLPLLKSHDKQKVEIFCYSDVVVPDAYTHQLQSHADAWRSIVGQNAEQVAAMIRADQIDILVDLTMHMAQNRLAVFARKPAPVQVCWLAYPGSTGLSAIDYRLSDPFLDPAGVDESVYSEKTIRLPETFWCYDPLEGREVPVNALPAQQGGAITFGCLNNFCKINEGTLGLWAHVLQRVEGSRLILLAAEGMHRARTLSFLQSRGVDPQRIQILSYLPRRQYMELYHQIDISLDTFPYNGHTTSLDSFWMGVPVVSFVGQTPVSRAGWCQLWNLGLPELAAHVPGDFITVATELAGDLPRLSQLRSTLRGIMEQSPLMDAPRFAGNIEEAYRQMWRTWCTSGT